MRITTLALAAGWVAVIIVAAGREPTDAPLLGVNNLGVVIFAAVGVVALAGLALLIYVLFDDPPEFTERKRSKRRFVLTIVAFVTFAILLWWYEPSVSLNELIDTAAVDQVGISPPPVVEPEPARETVAESTDILVVLALGAAAGGLWVAARRRARSPSPSTQPATGDLQVDMALALDNATSDLASTSDPRTAVLRAYASLEQVLADHDLDRRPSETRTEHVRRSHSSLRIDSTPLIELGELYEVARYSHNHIARSDQERALAALRRAREELNVAR